MTPQFKSTFFRVNFMNRDLLLAEKFENSETTFERQISLSLTRLLRVYYISMRLFSAVAAQEIAGDKFLYLLRYGLRFNQKSSYGQRGELNKRNCRLRVICRQFPCLRRSAYIAQSYRRSSDVRKCARARVCALYCANVCGMSSLERLRGGKTTD